MRSSRNGLRTKTGTYSTMGLILFCLLLVTSSSFMKSSASESGTISPVAPGNVTARARAVFSTSTTETFTLTARVFTGSTDCTSGGGAATTINNVGQAGYTIALGPTDSVLFTAAPLSDQSNLLVVADTSGKFNGWLVPPGQTGGLTVPPGSDGTQICVQGLDSPAAREVDANYLPAIQLRDSTCTTQLTAFHPGDTICIQVFGGLTENPAAPQHLFGAGGTGPTNGECTFLPIPLAYIPVDVTSDPSTYLYTFPSSNAEIPAACSSVAGSNVQDIRGPWRMGVRTPDNNGVSAIKTIQLTDPTCNLSCAANVSVASEPNQCGANVTYTEPSGAECGTVTCDHPSGSFFPVGETTVQCTSSTGPTCSFKVTVNDTQNPSITAPANASYQCASEAPAANPSQATASDNCGTPTVTVSQSNNGGAGSPASPLIITRTYTATDGSTNTASASQTITVIDNTPPTITCPGNITVNAPVGSCSAVVNFTVSGSDNCSSPTIVSSPASGSVFPVGTTTVTSTATDAAGNSQSCSFTVTVKDVTPPVITLNGQNITLWPPNHQYETVQVANLVASASDLCDPSINLGSVVIAKVTSDEPENSGGDGNTLNDIVIAANCKSVQLRSERIGGGNGRVYTITFKVTDASGNSSTATAKVTVPKSQNGASAVDNGPQYTVLSGCP